MAWNEEAEEIRELVEANLNYCEDEASFYERLLEILDSSISKVSFLEEAERHANRCSPWLHDKLFEFLNAIEKSEYL